MNLISRALEACHLHLKCIFSGRLQAGPSCVMSSVTVRVCTLNISLFQTVFLRLVLCIPMDFHSQIDLRGLPFARMAPESLDGGPGATEGSVARPLPFLQPPKSSLRVRRQVCETLVDTPALAHLPPMK